MDQDLMDWAKKQSENVRVALPDRMPDEPDVTPEQLRELRALGDACDPAEEEALGTWQAAYLIQRLREERRDLEVRTFATAATVQTERRVIAFWTNVLFWVLVVAFGVFLTTCF